MRLTPGKRHAHLGSTRVIPESARIKLHGSKELSQPALQTVPAQRFSEIGSTTSGQGVGIFWRHQTTPEIQPKPSVMQDWCRTDVAYSQLQGVVLEEIP